MWSGILLAETRAAISADRRHRRRPLRKPAPLGTAARDHTKCVQLCIERLTRWLAYRGRIV